MPSKTDLDHLVQSICKSSRETDASKILKEIEDNNEYIMDVQLKKLLRLHDTAFKERCVLPLHQLYDKYNESVLRHGDLQNWAELIDRDLRVLELTMHLAKGDK